MISKQKIINKLGKFHNKDIANKAILIMRNGNNEFTTTEYNSDRALFELKLHKKTTSKRNIETFGFNELINKLKEIDEDKLIVYDYSSDKYLLRIFMDKNEDIIGLFGLEERYISPEEKERIINLANGKR